MRMPALDIGSHYSTLSDDLSPLARFTVVPNDLLPVPQPNGDIHLCYPDMQEATFDIIGVIIGSCLEAPLGFPKSVSTFIY
jgi:hypothetical protein